MTGSELGIIVVGGAVGWWGVSWLIDRLQRRDRDQTGATPAPAGPDADVPALREPARIAAPALPAGELSVVELADAWPRVLGVARDAPLATIEAAYHERIAACDRLRFQANASVSERQQAADERRAIEAAYEFIRSARPG